MPIIQSIERALRILDLFDENETELKITEISERMGLSKSTVHSLLKTLQLYRYIEQNPENGKYRLGMKLFERGNFVISRLDIRTVAKRFLVHLSERTGQTTHLVILDGKEGVYIDKVEGEQAMILSSRIGRRIPLHATSVGKVFLAFKSKEELAKLLDGYDFYEKTVNTITTKERLMAELDEIRRQGYAVDNQEYEPGVRSAGVPIYNYAGEVAAAISITTTIARVDDKAFEQLIPLLVQVGQEISERMGYGILN
ncbi:IclR family transcriptional regulator [Paenibacillus validus]|uniref:IclR family transcriptional regulator n=1 Tax=Paenibacillus TaxID=44249 RepID=UPI000FDC96B9|nr:MULTISPECIES: IclR family transcriptional regulator [Paenibacillus]MED4600499.1 IclR family transcriptional regulator [Paenibacillus validus]MED4604758.1 IclR family transcriptional regulator [Paenibacillus validus]